MGKWLIWIAKICLLGGLAGGFVFSVVMFGYTVVDRRTQISRCVAELGPNPAGGEAYCEALVFMGRVWEK